MSATITVPAPNNTTSERKVVGNVAKLTIEYKGLLLHQVEIGGSSTQAIANEIKQFHRNSAYSYLYILLTSKFYIGDLNVSMHNVHIHGNGASFTGNVNITKSANGRLQQLTIYQTLTIGGNFGTELSQFTLFDVAAEQCKFESVEAVIEGNCNLRNCTMTDGALDGHGILKATLELTRSGGQLYELHGRVSFDGEIKMLTIFKLVYGQDTENSPVTFSNIKSNDSEQKLRVLQLITISGSSIVRVNNAAGNEFTGTLGANEDAPMLPTDKVQIGVLGTLNSPTVIACQPLNIVSVGVRT